MIRIFFCDIRCSVCKTSNNYLAGIIRNTMNEEIKLFVIGYRISITGRSYVSAEMPSGVIPLIGRNPLDGYCASNGSTPPANVASTVTTPVWMLVGS